MRKSLLLATVLCLSITQVAQAHDNKPATIPSSPDTIHNTNNNNNNNKNNNLNLNAQAQFQASKSESSSASNSASNAKSHSTSSSVSGASASTGDSNSKSQSNSGGNNLTSINDYRPAASTAIGTTVAFGNKNCGASIGFGVQSLGHGTSVGIPVPTPKCDAREDLLAAMAASSQTTNPQFWADVLMESFVTGDSKRTVYERRAKR